MDSKLNRLDVLKKIRPTMGNDSSEGKIAQTTIFCILDGDPITAEFWQPTGYSHGDHTEKRAFIFYPTTKWDFRPDGELRHYSAGTILWRGPQDKEEYCLFRRRAYPIGFYTIPAGHLEMGEEPKSAAIREAYEETQLGVLSCQPFYEDEIEEECRRGSDYHFWYAYLCQCIGEPRMSDEATVIGWFTRHEIIHNLELTKPTGVLFEKLFHERPKNIRPR